MAIRLPQRTHPGYCSVGSNQVMVAVGFLDAPGMGLVLPLVLAPAATQATDPIYVAGWNSFMLFVIYTGGGGTTTWEYNILDPRTQAVLFTRGISAATAPGTLLFTFGAASVTAGSAAGRGDVFQLISLKLTANAAAQTYSQVLLWAGVR
jgi:hypothetical protein